MENTNQNTSAPMKVSFHPALTEKEVELFFDFCYGDQTLDFSRMFYELHPEFKKMTEGVQDKEEFIKSCHEYTSDFINKNRKDIEEAVLRFEKVWGEAGNEVVNSLCQDFELSKVKLPEHIKAHVSINSVCPRYLDEWSFNLFYEFSDEYVRRVAIHEIIHFLYFTKWAEVFPDSNKENYEAPNSEWILSEILVHVIMNNNPKTQVYLEGLKSNVYDNWRELKIDNITFVDYFEPHYIKHLKGEYSFGEFLKKCWTNYENSISG
jgi:hypothetical protein